MQNNTDAPKKHPSRRFTNLSLLVIGIIMSVSGLFIQIYYHLLAIIDSEFSMWTNIHKWSALIFTLIILAHIKQHLKWYKGIFRKQLFRKNRITLFLTATMIIVSLLGFTPWLLAQFSTQFTLRHTLIEIHDKIGIVFMVIMVGHIIKRWKWYINLR